MRRNAKVQILKIGFELVNTSDLKTLELIGNTRPDLTFHKKTGTTSCGACLMIILFFASRFHILVKITV